VVGLPRSDLGMKAEAEEWVRLCLLVMDLCRSVVNLWCEIQFQGRAVGMIDVCGVSDVCIALA